MSFVMQGNMKQHMMTHKNRDGTPISLDLVNGMYSERSRGRCGAKDEQRPSARTDPVREHRLSLTIQHRPERPLDAAPTSGDADPSGAPRQASPAGKLLIGKKRHKHDNLSSCLINS